MARMTETFTLPRSQPRAAEIVRAQFPPNKYRWLHDHGWAFLAKERLDLMQMFLTHPVKFAVFVREESSRKAQVELHAQTFGIGPIPKRLLRKRLAELRQNIEAAI